MDEQQTILLVDDSVDDLFFMRIAFERAEFKNPLQQVHNGEEAISYLKGAPPYNDRHRSPLPAAMLLDLNMPLKNGFDVLDWVRKQPNLKRLPIFVLTASTRPEDIERAFDLGSNAFLVKPRSLEGLTRMIRCLRDWLQYSQFPSMDPSMKR